MKKLKFAVIGLGNIGSRHVAVLDAEENAEIVGVCDINKEKCENIINLYGKIPCFEDYKVLLKKVKADIVTVATPHSYHSQMVIDIIKSDKNALVEKPMALSVNDCDRMIETANKYKKKIFVVKQNRFNKPVMLAKKALDENRLGKIYMVQCNVMWNRNKEYYLDSEWRGKKEFEGGALHTQVSHFLDLMIWWFGDVVEARTFIDTLNHDIEIEDTGVSSLKFKSGVLGSLLWTTNVYNQNYEGSITILGEKGTIKIGGKYLNTIEFWDVKSYPLPDNIEFKDKPNNYGKYFGTSSNHDKLIHEIIKNFTHGMKGVVEGDEGKKTIEAIEMIYKNTSLSLN